MALTEADKRISKVLNQLIDDEQAHGTPLQTVAAHLTTAAMEILRADGADVLWCLDQIKARFLKRN